MLLTCLYYRSYLRSLCFSVTPVAGRPGEWEFDPETPKGGCDVYDDWNYGQYAKDVRQVRFNPILIRFNPI